MLMKTFALSATFLLLAACSKPEPSAPPPTLADAKSPEQVKAAVIQKQIAEAPQGDPAKPLAQYQELSSGKQLQFAQLALSRMPIDYDKVAERISSEYRSTQDAFKRKDIAAALKTGIDQEIAKVQQSGYYFMDLGDSPVLESFNFEKKSFKVKAFESANSFRYFNDLSQVRLGFSNGQAFDALIVNDEAKARDIEQKIGKYNELGLRVYMFLNGVELGEERVRAQVMKIELRDRKGTVVVAQ